MGEKFFNIILLEGNKTIKALINADSLYKTIDNFINSNNCCMCIFKASDKELKREIDKYYKAQYASLYSKYRRNKINKSQHQEALDKLKRIKSQSNTVAQFKQKFEEYKKSANNIPPYNVSD